MGKKSKAAEQKENTEGLLTIGQKKPETTSVFNNLATARVEKTIVVAGNKNSSGIEENNITVTPTPVVSKVIPAPPETVVYELTYLLNNVEKIVYTRDIPKFNSTKFELNITNGFGRSDLREVVLGQKEIKTSCYITLTESEFTIDMRNGLLIKVISDQDWMSRGYEETKKLFDETVLKAYRETSQTLPLPVKQEKGRQVARQQQHIEDVEENDFPVGNIPVNRTMLDI